LADDAEAMLVSIKATKRLSKNLADGIWRIGSEWSIRTDYVIPSMKSHDMMTARKNDAFDAAPSRGLKYVIGSDNIGLKHFRPIFRFKLLAKMNNSIDILHDIEDIFEVLEVSRKNLFTGAGKTKILTIRKTKNRKFPVETLT
jgi:hypothetical protein